MEQLQLQNQQLERYLRDAMNMLDFVKDKMGMFQTQSYYRLKREIELMEEQQKNSSAHTRHDSHYLPEALTRDTVIENCLTQQLKLTQQHIDQLKKVQDTLLATIQANG